MFSCCVINHSGKETHEVNTPHHTGSLPLFHCALETFILSLQHSGLRTDMRDFLIICPINAGRLVG